MKYDHSELNLVNRNKLQKQIHNVLVHMRANTPVFTFKTNLGFNPKANRLTTISNIVMAYIYNWQNNKQDQHKDYTSYMRTPLPFPTKRFSLSF